MHGDLNIAFDLRTTHLSGINRYGTSLLRNIINLLPATGLKIYALHWPEIRQRLIKTLGQTALKDQVEFVAISDDYNFVRDSAWLRNWLVEKGIQIYYTSHYIVDPELPIATLAHMPHI